MKADKVIQKHFKLLLSGYQNNFETSLRGNDFIFDCVFICHKINLNCCGSYIHSSD